MLLQEVFEICVCCCILMTVPEMSTIPSLDICSRTLLWRHMGTYKKRTYISHLQMLWRGKKYRSSPDLFLGVAQLSIICSVWGEPGNEGCLSLLLIANKQH